jgi:hypothetical protein
MYNGDLHRMKPLLALSDLILRVCFNLHKFSLYGKITAHNTHASTFFKKSSRRRRILRESEDIIKNSYYQVTRELSFNYNHHDAELYTHSIAFFTALSRTHKFCLAKSKSRKAINSCRQKFFFS